MKHINFYSALNHLKKFGFEAAVIVSVICGIAFASNSKAPAVYGDTFEQISSSPYYLFPSGSATYGSDTITNTESDTINMTANLLSAWMWNWNVRASQLSGTSSVIAVVQESSNASSSWTTPADWVEVGRDTVAAATTIRLLGDPSLGTDFVRGTKQRLILTGIGTQSTVYYYKFVGKKH